MRQFCTFLATFVHFSELHRLFKLITILKSNLLRAGIAAISMSLVATTLTDVNHSASAATADNNITIQAGPHLRPGSLPTIFSPAEPRVNMENNVIE